MKRYIILVALLLASGTALAHYHVWSKIGERETSSGYTICDWKCHGGGTGGSHMTSTSGYGYCPHP
ncbi:MAG: hypothetical protein ACYTEQ_27550 [Planctomycetota bacterium]|jgi:hypothetical protein